MMDVALRCWLAKPVAMAWVTMSAMLAMADTARAQPCEGGVWSPLIQRPVGDGNVAFDAARQKLVWFNGTETWESSTGETWELRATAGPGPRARTAIAYDPQRHVCILFGGQNFQKMAIFSDTWQWDGNVWSLISNSGPSARLAHVMVTDTDNARVLLFGGTDGVMDSNETWAWDGSGWGILHSGIGTAPSPRRSAAFSYDTARHRAVLFSGAATADTWEFDGASWIRMEPPSAPTPRSQCAMAFDPVRRVTVLSGGNILPVETWEWDGAEWSLRNSEPGQRLYQTGMAYVPVLGHLVRAGQYLHERWPVQAWDGTTWTPLGDVENTPSQLSWISMAYDSRRGRVVMHGTLGDLATTGLWELGGDQWVRRDGEGPATYVAMTYDSPRGMIIALEGGEGTGRRTWAWDGSAWSVVATSSPDGGVRNGMVFDSVRNVAVLYSSYAFGGPPSAIWEWDGVVWTRRSEAGPGDLSGAAMAFDSARGRSVLFTDDTPNDTWEWDGMAWHHPSPAHRPSRRHGYRLVYDSVRNRTVLMTGFSGGYVSDTWEWDGDDWTLVDTRGFSGRTDPGVAFDVGRNRIVLYGGLARRLNGETSNYHTADTWVRTIGPIGPNPTISIQPVDRLLQEPGVASFAVVADGGGYLSYQWRKNSIPVHDDSRITGSASSVLSINPTLPSDIGRYDVVISNQCASITSQRATLRLLDCIADFNLDGLLNSQDYFDFLSAFFGSDPEADFDGSGAVDSADFFAFLDAFLTNCD